MCGMFTLPKIPSSGQTNLKFLNQAKPAKPHVIKLQTKCQFSLSPSSSSSLSVFLQLTPTESTFKCIEILESFCCNLLLFSAMCKQLKGQYIKTLQWRNQLFMPATWGSVPQCVCVVRQCMCADVRVVDSHYVCVFVCVCCHIPTVAIELRIIHSASFAATITRLLTNQEAVLPLSLPPTIPLLLC